MDEKNTQDRSYKVGEIITINQVDWTVAETPDDKIRLYRERIDGSSQTMDVTLEELERLTDR